MFDSDEDALATLGAWLQRWRWQAGVSQRALASRAGIDQGGLSRVERGRQAIGSRRLARVVIALDELSGQTPMGRLAPPPVLPGIARDEPDDCTTLAGDDDWELEP
jgi:transcriptional regulator with XRE-family HTH domain